MTQISDHPASRAVATALAPAGLDRPELAIISDTICPWCYVGKRRLDRALAALAGDGLSPVVRWRPFELNPEMPARGMDRRAYRTAKFGSWERSQALDAQVAAVASAEGIAMRHDLVARTPNTRASHRVVWLAGEEGGPELQGRVVEELFAAYFTQGRDIGDEDVLAEAAGRAGLPSARVVALLGGGEGTAEVIREEARAQAAGIDGVPSVFLDGRYLFSGAQPVPVIVRALREAAAKPDAEGTGAHG